jgi:acetyl-CoA acetyltransferase
MSLRDIAVIGFAQNIAEHDRERNEVEFIIPVVRDAIAQSGIPRHDIGFTVSGSCDYLSGGPFTFVQGLDAVGAWPPIKESHLEMDAAWALYEAWVAIQVGDVDSALIYGFGKSSLGDVHEIFNLMNDPYSVMPLWPSTVDLAALQACAAIAAKVTDERELAEIASRDRRAALGNPHAIAGRDVSAEAILGEPVTHAPLRDADIAPVTDGAAAIVIAAGDIARGACERPAWIRGIEHRIEPLALGVRDLTRSESTRLAAVAADVGGGAVEVAELHTQFSHEEPILRAALGLGSEVEVNPSGGPLGANPIMSTGLIRIGEVASRIHSGAVHRGVAHATQGPCLQQNLVCVLEGESN